MAYITKHRGLAGLGYAGLGSTGSDAAKAAQQFLVTNGGAKIAVDGIFGPQSTAAQNKYAADGLAAAKGVAAGTKTMAYAGCAQAGAALEAFCNGEGASILSSGDIGKLQSKLFPLVSSCKIAGGGDVVALPAFNRVNTFLQYPAVQVTGSTTSKPSGGGTSTVTVPTVVAVSPKLPSLTGPSTGVKIAIGAGVLTVMLAGLYFAFSPKST